MANFITILRFPLLFGYVALLYFGSPTLQLWGALFILLIIYMDSLDGMIARARGETSLLGSVLDIATDRTLEIVMWVVFAHLGLIPIIIPLIVITRGTTVDAIRAMGMQGGLAPFQQVRSKISRALVSSPFMRSSYGVAKALAFAALSVDLGLRNMSHPWSQTVHTVALTLSWLAITMTILRGLPVLIEGFRSIRQQPPENITQPNN